MRAMPDGKETYQRVAGVFVVEGLAATDCDESGPNPKTGAAHDQVGRRVSTATDGHFFQWEATMMEPDRLSVQSPYLTAAEAATYLRTTIQGIYSLVKRGRLHPMPGRPGRLLFTRDGLDRYLARRG